MMPSVLGINRTRDGTLVRHVSTDRRRFRAQLRRWTGRFAPLAAAAWLAGEQAPPRHAGKDRHWPACAVPVPAHCPQALRGAWCKTAGAGIHAACMAVFTHGGTVSDAGSTDWPQTVVAGQGDRVAAITRNVIARPLGEAR